MFEQSQSLAVSCGERGAGFTLRGTQSSQRRHRDSQRKKRGKRTGRRLSDRQWLQGGNPSKKKGKNGKLKRREKTDYWEEKTFVTPHSIPYSLFSLSHLWWLSSSFHTHSFSSFEKERTTRPTQSLNQIDLFRYETILMTCFLICRLFCWVFFLKSLTRLKTIQKSEKKMRLSYWFELFSKIILITCLAN